RQTHGETGATAATRIQPEPLQPCASTAANAAKRLFFCRASIHGDVNMMIRLGEIMERKA
ncbi:hypothetical protein RDABS01_017160, partial [Bienertia sinuspersici]